MCEDNGNWFTQMAQEIEIQNGSNFYRKPVPSNIKAEQSELANFITPGAEPPPDLLKCSQCPYLTLEQERLDAHRNTHSEFPNLPPRLSCPGCTNYFYHRDSLEMHLLRDHQVDQDEINNIRSSDAETPQAKTKSRISIKSVDVLRAPLRNPSFNTSRENSFPEISQFTSIASQDLLQIPMEPLTDLPNSHQQQRQKIYLKNVNELQDQPQTNLFQSDFDQFQNLPFQSPLSFPIIQSEFNDNVETDSGDQAEVITAITKNKIYIRNVQTLIRPEVQKQSDLATELTGPGNSNSSFLHLRSVDDINLMNLEEVQSLPPQRNDIVVLLDDFNEEPQMVEQPFFIVQPQHCNPVQQPPSPMANTSPVDVEELELAVISCLEANETEGVKLLAEAPVLNMVNNGETANNSYNGVYRTEPVDESSFYYKNLEENISQLIFSTSAEVQDEPVQVIEPVESQQFYFPFAQVTEEELEQTVKLTKPDKGDDLNTPPPTIADSLEDNVTYLPDESDVDVCRNGFTPSAVNNLTEPQEAVDSPPHEVVPETVAVPSKVALVKKGRGRPRGGRNYGKDGKEFPFECSESGCPRRFNQKSNLDYHQRCHQADSEDIICPECESKEAGRSWNSLHSHLWRQHSIDMELYACTECNFKTPCLSVLKNTHMKIHSEEKTFKCEVCEKLYKNQKQLKNHRRRHRIVNELEKDWAKLQKPLACNLCDPVIPFEDKSLFRKHNFQFHRKVRNRCEECKKPFLKAVDLQMHIKKDHKKKRQEETIARIPRVDGPQKTFKCDHCPYETCHRNCARRHKMTHNGEKKYNCQFCDYSCIQSKSFRAHLQRVHPESVTELIFKCSQCDFTTINKVQLKFHLAKHNGMDSTTKVPADAGLDVASGSCHNV